MPTPNPSTAIVIRPDGEKAFSEPNFRRDDQRVTPRIGPAWLDRDPDTGERNRRRGRMGDGSYDERGVRRCRRDRGPRPRCRRIVFQRVLPAPARCA